MKPGRNDPCPCGSGKKYEHCCLPQDETVAADELTWRRVRRAIEPLSRELLTKAARRFGAAELDDAWAEFNLFEVEQPFDEDSPLVTLSLSWFLHDRTPGPNDTQLPPAVFDSTVAQAYVKRAGGRLDPIGRRYVDVESCCAVPFSFHEVIDCRPGQGMRLRDVLLGTEIDVIETTGSRTLRVGDIVFAKVVPIEASH